MTNGAVKLGLCPIGKFVFSHQDAVRYKGIVEKKLRGWRMEYVNIDDAVADGMVRDIAHVEPVVRHLKAHGVDGVFMPHCNFGTESAVGLIGRDLGVPVLLWGPRDDAPLPDGTRLRDSLCGLLASSKVLHKLDVPFTYIENCSIEDGQFEAGLKNFLRAMSVVTRFRHMRIGQIGQRVDFFWTTICNEGELLERFGIQIEPLDIAEVIRATKARAEKHRARYRDEVEGLRKKITIEGFEDLRPFVNVLALRDEMLSLAREYDLSALAVKTFMSLVEELGAMVEFAMSQVSEAGVPTATECDLHGAISCALLRAASLNTEPTFLADFTVRHPEDDNGVLLWHGDFPLALRREGTPASVGTHWILPNVPSGMCHWQLRDGDITVARFDGDRGDYRLAAGEGRTIAGPRTQNTYVWMRVNNWPRWERQLIEGPYIHHTGAVYGQYAPALMEACKYIPGLTPEPLGQDLADVQREFFGAAPPRAAIQAVARRGT